jgi:hypothetical protein
MGLAVWAQSSTAPNLVCEDLPDTGEAGEYSPEARSPHGKGGWDERVGFGTAVSLVRNLRAQLAGRLVSRLGINAHGYPGYFDLDSVLSNSSFAPTDDAQVLADMLSRRTFEKFLPALTELGTLLTTDAIVILEGCMAAGGPGGAQLLISLSDVWRGRRVVGFTTVQHTPKTVPGRGCTWAGNHDTPYENESYSEQQRYARYGQGKLSLMPYAHESSTHAKIALNGKLIKDPEKLAPSPLPGVWRWLLHSNPAALKPREPDVILFRFDAHNKVSWQPYRTDAANSFSSRPLAPPDASGRWWNALEKGGNSYMFEFDSDPKGWKRVFTARDVTAVNAKVSIAFPDRPGGGPRSAFTMTREQ